jgi:hypothetical protein
MDGIGTTQRQPTRLTWLVAVGNRILSLGESPADDDVRLRKRVGVTAPSSVGLTSRASAK